MMTTTEIDARLSLADAIDACDVHAIRAVREAELESLSARANDLRQRIADAEVRRTELRRTIAGPLAADVNEAFDAAAPIADAHAAAQLRIQRAKFAIGFAETERDSLTDEIAAHRREIEKIKLRFQQEAGGN